MVDFPLINIIIAVGVVVLLSIFFPFCAFLPLAECKGIGRKSIADPTLFDAHP